MSQSNSIRRFRVSPLAAALGSALVAGGMLASPAALAQDEEQRRSATSVLTEEVIVTARKREETLQDVPVAVTAYGEDQLEALKIRKLDDLSVAMPNVSLDDIGTTRGNANFQIRGLGINSSIPSIDPAVGVFVNGIYMGLNAGVVFDQFDMESIQVLRGPQGTLFGRNVTGGAILIEQKDPGEELEMSARAAIDGNPNGDAGLNYTAMASVSGPLTDVVSAKLAVYWNTDQGWHVNQFDGQEFGEADTTIIRPAVAFRPSDGVEVILRYEYFETQNDGPAAQNHAGVGVLVPGVIEFPVFDRESFDFSIDETGKYDAESDFISAEANFDVDFGEGQITYLFGWRDYYAEGLGDIDATPVHIFHAPSELDDEQISHELRYNGRFDNVNVTAGLYQFSKDLLYTEIRLLPLSGPPGLGGITQSGGGDYKVDQWSAFIAFDVDVTERLTLTAGANYSEEEKDVEITSLSLNVRFPYSPTNVCSVVNGTCDPDFFDDDSWDAFAPKLGARYALSDDSQVYGHWTRGFRSGGYNLRNTSADIVNNGPGPFDQETVDSFEIGYKSSLGGRGQLNAALFYTELDDMQREVNLPDPTGVVQIIKNTGSAEITGFEIDGTFNLGAGTLLTGSLGVMDAEYTELNFDLSSPPNGETDDDLSKKIPRVPDLTWSVGLVNDTDLGDWGVLTSRINYAYRDAVAYTDSNAGVITDQEILFAALDLYSNDGHWVFSLYGNNLLNDVKHGGDTQLSWGSFSPLAKGRVVGAEVSYKF